MNSTTSSKPTFAEILEETRDEAARAAWRRAALVSKLRHAAVATGNYRAARAFAAAKVRSMHRAIELAGNQITIVCASDDPVRLYSVRFTGEKAHALHIPKQRLAI
jgi:hypothetical protein